MNKALYELMWASHRAECEAAVPYGAEGLLPDVRNEQQIAITPDSILAFNLGTIQGIKTLLSHLHNNGYTIQSPTGETIKPDHEPDLGAAYNTWLSTPPEIKGVVLKDSGRGNANRGYRPSTSSYLKLLSGHICLNGVPVRLDLTQGGWVSSSANDHVIERCFQIGDDRYVLRQFGNQPVHELRWLVLDGGVSSFVQCTSLQISNDHEVLNAFQTTVVK